MCHTVVCSVVCGCGVESMAIFGGFIMESYNFKVNMHCDTILVDQRSDYNELFHSQMTVACVNLSRRSKLRAIHNDSTSTDQAGY